jgi:hypothetical protein
MFIYPVSFGKKIPVAKCHIIDNQKKKAVPATVYEYDCKNADDVEDLKSANGE